MPASTIGDRRHILFDKLLELRPREAAALSATTSDTALLFLATKILDYTCVINTAAYTGYTAGTNEWTITIEASTAPTTGFVTVATVKPTGTASQFNVPLGGSYIHQLKPGAIYLRVTATKAGTAGNLQFGAFLTRVMI